MKIEGIDTCELLSADQRSTLGVEEGEAGHEAGRFQGTNCAWSSFLQRPRYAWVGSLTTNTGAEFALGKEQPLRFVQGFAAPTTGSVGTDPRWYCAMFVDIGPGQSLGASYDNDSKDAPGMNHQLACDKAQQLAEYMLTALRARQPS